MTWLGAVDDSCSRTFKCPVASGRTWSEAVSKTSIATSTETSKAVGDEVRGGKGKENGNEGVNAGEDWDWGQEQRRRPW